MTEEMAASMMEKSPKIMGSLERINGRLNELQGVMKEIRAKLEIVCLRKSTPPVPSDQKTPEGPPRCTVMGELELIEERIGVLTCELVTQEEELDII